MNLKRFRIRKRIPLTIAVVMSSALVLASCSSGDSAGDSTTESSSSTTQSDDASGDTTGASASQSTSTGSAEECTDVEGVTDDSITLGGSYPLSGPLSSAAGPAWGAQAYFAYVNDNGGVNGRSIDFKFYDDAYDPSRTVANVQKSLGSDHVFAMFNIFGTAPNIAVYDMLNEEGVPQIYPVSGDARWGDNAESHPWTIPWQPTLQGEGAVYGKYLAANKPDAKVAVLYQNDDFGESLLSGFKTGIGDSNVTIAKAVSYEVSTPSVAPQVSVLSNSGADVFLNFTTQQFATQAIKAVGGSSWDPLHMMTNIDVSVAAVLEPAGLDNAQGIVSTAFLKDPSDPQWADSEDMVLYKEQAAKSIPSTANVNDSLVAQGWSTAATFVHAIESIQCPTRDNLMTALRSIDGYAAPLLLPGVEITTAPDDPFAIEQLTLIKFTGSEWQPFGDAIDISAKALQK